MSEFLWRVAKRSLRDGDDDEEEKERVLKR